MTHLRDLALLARSFQRPQTRRLLPLNPDLGYWGGVVWHYHATITNAAGASGNQETLISPGDLNEMELLYGICRNDDTVARTMRVTIEDALGNVIGEPLRDISTNPGNTSNFPTAQDSDVQNASGDRFHISGSMVLRQLATSIAVSEDTSFGVAFRIRGEKPTVSYDIPAGATVSVATDELA